MMRSIDTARFKDVSARPMIACGPAPDMRWVEIDRLVVDPAYQREITKQGAANVKRIAEAFDWRFFSAVVVSPVEGGRFAIIDGQHRTTAARICGFEQVPCQIVHAAPHEQAAAFDAINGATTKVSAQSRFRAAVAAGDVEAVRAKRLADAAGIRLLFYPLAAKHSMAEPGDTNAIGLVLKICAKHDDRFITLLFRALRAAAGDICGQLSMLAIRGFAEVLADHREWLARDRDLIAACELILPSDLTEAARRERARRPNVGMDALFQAELLTAIERQMKRAA
jgi:hypothetical protein